MVLYYFTVDKDGSFNIPINPKIKGPVRLTFLQKEANRLYENWVKEDQVRRESRKFQGIFSVDITHQKRIKLC